MNALRVIRLDASDTFGSKGAAHPGGWALAGAWVFTSADPGGLRGKARAAFRCGFVGIGPLGWSTLVRIVAAMKAERARTVDLHQIIQRFAVPNPAMAGAAAEQEIDFAVSLADHPSGVLAAVSRMREGRSIGGSFRALSPAVNKPTSAFAFLRASGEDEERVEEVDLISLTRRVAR